MKKGRRLAHPRLQGRRPRPPGEPERARPHSPLRDIAAAISKLSARTLVLDGEVAIYDQQLRSRFDWLREPDPAAVATPPFYMAFDLLYCDRRAIPS
jgi:ATP-dependent DNA ligase